MWIKIYFCKFKQGVIVWDNSTDTPLFINWWPNLFMIHNNETTSIHQSLNQNKFRDKVWIIWNTFKWHWRYCTDETSSTLGVVFTTHELQIIAILWFFNERNPFSMTNNRFLWNFLSWAYNSGVWSFWPLIFNWWNSVHSFITVFLSGSQWPSNNSSAIKCKESQKKKIEARKQQWNILKHVTANKLNGNKYKQ